MKWIVDRTEEGVAVLEDPETMETRDCPLSELPHGVKEGDVLTEEDGVLRIDIEAGRERAARISERFDTLKKKG